MFSYTVKIYEKSATTEVKINALVETFKIDESLDSAVLSIPRLARADAFARFSPVEIVIDDGNVERTHWWLVYTPKSELTSYAPTPRYEHTLGLIEPTKWLDKFACGTLTFTQPLGGTRYTLYDVVERLRQLTPFVPYASVSTTRLFTIDSELATYLDGIEAPQLYMDKKNLREALIEVFRYVNAIPRLDYVDGAWVLTADFINKRHLPFDIESQIIDYNNEASGEDYAQKVELYHENTITIDDDVTSSVYANSLTDTISFRSTDVVLASDDLQVQLNYKVARLLSAKIILTEVLSSTPFRKYVEIDITDYIPEKKVFDSHDLDGSSATYKYNYQSHNMFWTYGSNIIGGAGRSYGVFSLFSALMNIIADLQVVNEKSYKESEASGYFSVTMNFEYIPYIEQMKSEQYREDTTPYGNQANMLDRYATLQVNPQERINSLFQLTKNAYGQIQRLGVDTVAFSRRHRALTTFSGVNDGIYELGDYTEDGYFITKKEIVYFNSFVIARYEMSRNFNRIAQFVNIDKEFRPYEISLNKSDLTLRRNISMPFRTVEINTSNSGHVSNSLVVPFMLTFKDGTALIPFSSAAIHVGTTDPSESYYDYGSLLPLIISAEKNALKWKIDLQDTKLSGKRVVGQTTLVGTVNYYKQLQVAYTESDGTAELYRIVLYNDYWSIIEQLNTADSYYVKSVVGISKALPYIDTTKNVACGGTALGEAIAAEEHADSSDMVLYGSAINGAYYITLDDYNIYQYDSGTTTYVLQSSISPAVAMKAASVFTLPTYRVLKDGAEILSFELSVPIVAHKDLVNTFVIGDWFVQDNALIKNRSVGKDLYFWTSSQRFDKAETKNIASFATRSATTVSGEVSSNSISVETDIVNSDLNFAIADYDGNLYLGVNQINFDGTVTNVSTIYFNFKDERA